MYCTLDRRSCNGRCRAHVVGLVLCSHPPHSTTALHRTKLDFRESGMPETGFPRMSLLGSSVNRGKGKGRSPCTTYLGLPATGDAGLRPVRPRPRSALVFTLVLSQGRGLRTPAFFT